ncbi:related to PA and RING finger domain protein [Cephalotrichum gorgonifer]|uniref:Related to PA and RING finger domain protein n=1 Tax=Cephalotrichum gorgonifer TaxID=2041049 RepID=A0AAE8MSQ9_9PEZI|nr:related to PA and RING finger domain protein [Cephalotrichum gorgonifer]
MRPPRIAMLLLCLGASSFIFFRALAGLARATVLSDPITRSPSRLSNFFSFSTPLTLFPPNAVVSLTDDNSTSFPARPAAFGPSLPHDGLSGQLWIGSGFADDNLQEGEGEGELGCSDIPGWEDGISNIALKFSTKVANTGGPKDPAAVDKTDLPKRGSDPISPLDRNTETDPILSVSKSRIFDDGTDDYLQQGIALSPKKAGTARSSGIRHADIQSLQEAAEISGKIVLLSRGGCGFLEKTKWAQRRGAKALIVGDNRKGGPLIQMFARGDTSNVTIPSVFTARTTAHLLSSLTQPGSFIEDTIDENGHASFKVQHSDTSRRRKKTSTKSETSNPPLFPKSTESRSDHKTLSRRSAPDSPATQTKRGWFSWLFGSGKSSTAANGISPPSGDKRQDWVLVEDWDEQDDQLLSGSASPYSGDGVESEVHLNDDLSDNGPGNGDAIGTPANSGESAGGEGQADNSEVTEHQGSPLSTLFGEHDDDASPGQILDNPRPPPQDEDNEPETEPPEREGLWVTITPTNSAGSFFDTLLVLVISPLITLTVVHSNSSALPSHTFPDEQLSNNTSTAGDTVQAETSFSNYYGCARVEQLPSVSSEWKKYMGRQVECVVCLEEYVDGVSRVMSLPCGHEFHAECITPWLTTRRRTCPICKGDVVRSLARGTPSSPRHAAYHDSSDDEDIRPPVRSNTGGNQESDLERGTAPILTFRPFPARTPASRIGAWFGSLSGSFGSSSSPSSTSPEPEDPRRR